MKYIVTNKFSSFCYEFDSVNEARRKATALANEYGWQSVVEYYYTDKSVRPDHVDLIQPTKEPDVDSFNVTDENNNLIACSIEEFPQAVMLAQELADTYESCYHVCESFGYIPMFSAFPKKRCTYIKTEVNKNERN